MDKQSYFYQFIEPLSKELALVARELENSIFTSPRTMLTHARVFVENILQQVIRAEELPDDPRTNLKDQLDMLNDKGYLIPEIRDALHFVRQIGNQAAHNSRMFRYSEALLSWEALYKIVKWYVEVYGPVDITVPDYQDPSPAMEKRYDMSELEIRLKSLEELLSNSVEKLSPESALAETAVSVETSEPEVPAVEEGIPGTTTIRTFTFNGKQLDVPYFLRDAFLLPQRFDKSETFLIRLGAEQQARIMSELPMNLAGLHKHVKRYSEKNDEIFFEELRTFIEEEKIRRKLSLERPGELFFFYKADHIIVTEELSKVPLTSEEFTGIPSLLRQLNEDQIESVGQLPKELVILAKYENVGIGTVEKLFEQLKKKVNEQAAVVPEVEESYRASNKRWDSLYINVRHGKSNTVIRGESVPALWKEGLNWIEDHQLPLHEKIKEGVVLGSTDSGKRYAMALEPVHKDKRNFTQLHTYKSKLTGTTYYLETKINPKSGLETLAKLLIRLGVEVKIPLLESND
ncbi:DUF4145 domain-containing protein [Neobacillus sp. DY30]|uniref:DUF4145 domain-containing protein n=1 Tax=Neobacillus sp. DY30 TaxID=3047871 RepID=UPI0024C06CDB|nr:DUF4145 domain-containing protein [Neobacillus sp. DY30]WHX98392.1 DUF4145 domain-containing protein [Neobacillus sp. DY30]